MMTKVAKLFEEEKMEALRQREKEVTKKVTEKVTKEVTKEVAKANARALLVEGDSIEKVARCIKVLKKKEIKQLAREVNTGR